jgi:ADP-ribose pyrophosphatase YjhB (NUDIX family)
MVSPQFVRDVKQRWERAEFSAVSSNYLILGDVFVRRRGDPLELQDECDIEEEFVSLGRNNLSYDVWSSRDGAHKITAVRPKINGERFVYRQQANKFELVGFKTLSVSHGFVPRLVEYYAGEWFVLYPLITQPLVVTCVDAQQQSVQITFNPHPFMPPAAYFQNSHKYVSHKYDGVMVQLGGDEFRAKWDPTQEVSIEGEVFEVALRDTLVPIRPRPGKDVSSISAAMSSIRRCFRGRFVVPFLRQQSAELPREMKQTMEAATSASVHRVGAKCLFVTRGGKIVLIREVGKRLDLIGGVLEYGETPLDALLREIYEEVAVRMQAGSFYYFGVSKEEADGGSWLSHIFVAVAPDEIMRHESVETYQIDNFSEWTRSSSGRPRQVWMARHMDYFSDRFTSWDQLWTFLVMVQGGDFLPRAIVPNKFVRNEAGNHYVARVASVIAGTDVAMLGDHRTVLSIPGGNNSQYVPFATIFAQLQKLHYPLDSAFRRAIIQKFHSTYSPLTKPSDIEKRILEVENTLFHGAPVVTGPVAYDCVELPEHRDDCARLANAIWGTRFSITAQEFNVYLVNNGYTGSLRPRKRLVQRMKDMGLIGERVVSNSGGGREYYRMT